MGSISRARVVVGIGIFLVLQGGTAIAQAHEADGHPARIQLGSCSNLGGVAFQLTGVGAQITAQGTPAPAAEPVGSADAVPIQLSETVLDTSLSKLLDDPHAIVVYESDEAMDRIIACGNVGGVLESQMEGMVMPGDELITWLGEEEDSGYAGAAIIRADGRQAIVRLILAAAGQDDPQEEPGAGATPHAD